MSNKPQYVQLVDGFLYFRIRVPHYLATDYPNRKYFSIALGIPFTSNLSAAAKKSAYKAAEQLTKGWVADIDRELFHPNNDKRWYKFHFDVNDGIPTFSEFAKTYLAKRTADGIKAVTVETDEWHLKHLGIYFGEYRLDRIDYKLVEKWRDKNRPEAGERGFTTFKGRIRVLKDVMQHASNVEPAVTYSFATMKAPKDSNPKYKKPSAERFYKLDEINRLYAAADNQQMKAMILLGFYGGLRAGEVTALRLEDLDFDRRQIKIRKAVSGRDGIENAPKTPSSVREVYMHPHLKEVLFDFLSPFWDEIDARAWYEPDFVVRSSSRVFRSIRTGKPFTKPNNWRDEFVNARQRIGLLADEGYGFHGLRHSHASYRPGCRGEDITIVSKQLGHENKTITINTYQGAGIGNLPHTWDELRIPYRAAQTGGNVVPLTPKSAG